MSKNKQHKTDSTISRRSFVNLTASGAAAVAFIPVTKLLGDESLHAEQWPANASDFRFHMIGHAHIDPVWLWPWSEGISVALSTFRSALDRMNETKDVTFISSSAQFYQWVAENDPDMLNEIRKRVEEGRWNMVGGWWIEPDVNIPCGEALVRQGLYGQMTFQKLLGRKAKVAFNPDSFGHTGTLPQIIKQQGMGNYIFMRPAPHEKSIPADLFWWEGSDGTRVLTYRIQLSYNDNGNVRSRMEKIISQSADQPMKSFMAYYGAGDHGGGATKENINSIEEFKQEKGAPSVFYSTPERYFDEIRNDMNLDIPAYRGDLQHHAAGCYTADSSIKKGNRHSEAVLITAEKIASIGSVSWDFKYPFDELTAAWKKILFLQFHDSLAGTSLFEHSETAKEGHGFASDIARSSIYLSLQKLEWQVATDDPASQYIIAFNPHAWEITRIIEYDLNWGNNLNTSRVEDDGENSLLHQWTAGSTETGSRKKLLVKTTIPPLGYRQLRLMNGEGFNSLHVVSATQNTLENEYIRVVISNEGTINVTDKETGKKLFAGTEGGCRALIIDDPSDTWSHDVKTFSNVIGAFKNGTTKLTESGPLRATIRSATSYGNSNLIIDWSLCSGSRSIEAKVTLDWKEHLKMLKFSFPVDVESPVATYETPYGFIVREGNGDEDPGQRWIDVTGKRNGETYGFTLINDAKYGYSVHGNDLRLSVARSAVFAHHNPRVLDMKAEHFWMDQGIQTFRMMLVPHSDSWQKNGIPRVSEEFISRPLVIYQGIHRGSMPKSGSFLSVTPENVIISSIKRSETGEDIILRCVETSGNKSEASVDLKFAGLKWVGPFRPCEIKTLRINIKSGKILEVNLLEE